MFVSKVKSREDVILAWLSHTSTSEDHESHVFFCYVTFSFYFFFLNVVCVLSIRLPGHTTLYCVCLISTQTREDKEEKNANLCSLNFG